MNKTWTTTKAEADAFANVLRQLNGVMDEGDHATANVVLTDGRQIGVSKMHYTIDMEQPDCPGNDTGLQRHRGVLQAERNEDRQVVAFDMVTIESVHPAEAGSI